MNQPFFQYSKNKIDKAGDVLANKPSQDISQDEAVQILENFRAVHIHPMMVFKMSLYRKAEKLKNKVLISRRLKRAPSIINKLKLQKNMALSQMQDVGGIRAVTENLEDVYELRNLMKESEKQTAFKSTLIREDDYINKPKESGYRSIHLVYKYDKNVLPDRQCRVEIQIRSKIQHAWATAIEIIGTYLRQPLKQSLGNEEILELFKKISLTFSYLEQGKFDYTLYKSASEEINRLKLKDQLKSFRLATRVVKDDEKKGKGKYYLITLNFKDKSIRVKRYTDSNLDEANRTYSKIEKEYLNDKNFEVVLVSVDDVSNLQKLYPNYFLDSEEFLSLINKIENMVYTHEHKKN